MPILLLLGADLVRKMFCPIAVLAAKIDQRTEQDLRPVLNEHLPVEVRPVVVAIHRLLDRVAESMEGQRRLRHAGATTRSGLCAWVPIPIAKRPGGD